jgi:hypothetical protein
MSGSGYIGDYGEDPTVWLYMQAAYAGSAERHLPISG